MHKTNLWGELAKRIVEDMLDPKKVFPEHRKNLEEEIKQIIDKFVSERIARCYFMVNKSEVDKVTCQNGGD